MKVSNNNNLSFKSRCAEVRFAQDISSAVRKEYPGVLLSKFKPLFRKNWNNSYGKHVPYMKIQEIISRFNDIRTISDASTYEAIKGISDFAKKFRMYNCFEAARLSEFALKLNGIKNSYIASIYDNSHRIDHVITLFNKDKSEYNGSMDKAIIIDSWAGICDFAKSYFQELQHSDLTKHFGRFSSNSHLYLNNVDSLEIPNKIIAQHKDEYKGLILNKSI